MNVFVVFNSSYQIQLRRQAKVQSPLCKDSLHALWSDWSPVVDVPLGSISAISVNECCSFTEQIYFNCKSI